LKHFLIKDNFYFRYFFFGLEGIEALLPSCYQEKYFDVIKNNLHKITLVDGEAVEFLLSASNKSVTKASLSNIFEYTTHEEFNSVCHDLAKANPNLTFIYWNLLQEQVPYNGPSHTYTPLSPNNDSCFYFKNAFLINYSNQ
jgi:S-adenosylmethionine-diacylglycerol 3-amino-3-carboxypropyl transferase